MAGEQGERNDLKHTMLESVKLPVTHMNENTESKAIGSGRRDRDNCRWKTGR